jgi:hypothetical protein
MRRLTWPRITRDTTSFLLGIALLIHEAFIYDGATRPEFITAAVTLIGFPVVARRDEKKAADADPSPAVGT